jgi:2-amino-4-hydroxy-6-hydroxymethyldihydropteridine diphosphokinase
MSIPAHYSLALKNPAATGVALSLGTNCGERARYMRFMVDSLTAILQPPLVLSVLMETEPLKTRGRQTWYFNRIIRGRFQGTPYELLEECRRIERRAGRKRPFANAPRTADIDILLYGDAVSADPACLLPHPRLLERRFCLEGLCQIAPDWSIPGQGRPVLRLCREISSEVAGQKIIFYEQ